MADAKLIPKELALTGKLITANDPTTIGDNFRELTNLRYTDVAPEGIGGMSKINTSVLAVPRQNIRSMWHYRKSQPAESHVIVQAFNATGDKSTLYECSADVPNQGPFSSLFAEPDNASVGVFSEAPGQYMAYCNGKGSYLWGGNEARVGSFINYALNFSFWYDYTENVRDTKTTGSSHIATLKRVAETYDGNTVLLMKMNNNANDDSGSSHVVANNNVTYDASVKVFGTHSGVFNGSTAYYRIPDHADFDFASGNFNIDTRVRLDTVATLSPIYYQANKSATAHTKLYVDSNGALKFAITDSTGDFVMTSPNSTLSADTWYHVEVDEQANNYYLFVDGKLKAQSATTRRARGYNGSIDIGYDNHSSNFFDGRMDEYRVSDVTRHTAEFEIPDAEYSTTISNRTYMLVGTILPAQGIKPYIETANTTAGTLNVEEWNGSVWTDAANIVDGTAITGGTIPLGQTGTISFTSTEATSKAKIIKGVYLHWYRISVTDCDADVTVSHVTIDQPFQTIKDSWDGHERSIFSTQKFTTSYTDFTLNLFDDEYDSANAGTYMELDGLTSAMHIVSGFDEEMAAIHLHIVPTKGNTTANTLATISYWNGTAYVSVGTVDDGTSENGISLSKSGIISWNPPSFGTEFRNEISNESPLFYYKLEFSQTLSADVQLYYISGIPAQKEINAFNAPTYALGRLWLLGETDGFKHRGISSAFETPAVFNGEDSLEIYFGDEQDLRNGIGLYMQLGSSIYDVALVLKDNEVWMLIQDGADLKKFRISNTVGLTSPNSLKVMNISNQQTPTTRAEVPIWQSSNGNYFFDGKGPVPIADDIDNLFDRREAVNIMASMDRAYAFSDNYYGDWHWLVGSKEYAFNVQRNKWFQIERPTPLRCGTMVEDTSGRTYTYGGTAAGQVYRLEHGNSFDGTAINHTLWTGDIAIHGGKITESMQLKSIQVAMVSKKVTNNDISCSYYKDCSNTADETFTIGVNRDKKRVTQQIFQLGKGPATFHGFKFEASTDNERFGFSPLALGMLYEWARQKKSEAT